MKFLNKINTLVVGLLIVITTNAQTIYVDINAAGTNNGSSWANAYNDILDAVNAASNGNEIWVAQGTYYLHQSGPSGDTAIWLKTGVDMYGGFNGTETLLTERDWDNNITIIDAYNDAGGMFSCGHAIIADNVTNCTLDGFTIQHADSYNNFVEELDPVACASVSGGGGNSSTSAESVLNCVSAGGGLLINQSDPTISNCIITNNSARKGGGAYIMVATSTSNGSYPAPSFYNCDFMNNFASTRGGAISLDLFTNPTFTNCNFIGNTCDSKGGGLYLDWDCDPVLINCLLAENYAERGGAMAIDGSSTPELINCTVTNNEALDIGAGLYTGSYNSAMSTANTVVVTNSIVWGNRASWGGPVDFAIWHENHFYLEYSVVGTGFVSNGTGNITVDPMFADTANGDYSLLAGSPCINSGTASGAPIDDINGGVRDGSPDMGAFEYSGAVSCNVSVVVTGNNVTTNGGNDGDATTTVSGGQGNITYSWSPGGETTSTITNLSAGTYTVTVTDDITTGCTATGSITITEPIACNTTVTATSQTDPTCNGGTDGTITVSTTGFTTPSYAWSSGGTGLTESNLGAGSFEVIVSDGSCADSLTITLTEPAAITYTAVSTPATCGVANGDITLTASGGDGGPYQYNFNNLGFQASGTFTGLNAGLYPMAILDASSCLLTGPESIGNTGGAVIDSEVPSNVSTCGGTDGSITISTSGGSGTYSFSTDGGSTFTSSTSPYSVSVGAGSYSIVVDDGNCQTTGSIITITEPTPPSAPTAAGGASYCDGDIIANLTVAGTGGTYTWYDDAGLTNVVGTGMFYSPASVVGSSTYYVTETSGTCESTSASATVTVTTTPTVSAGNDQTVCEGASITLSGSGATTYSWDNGVTDGVSFLANTTTTYTVTGTTSGCSGTDVVIITVNALPTVTMDQISVGPICNSAAAVTLVGAPTGGTFSGNGVTGSSFDPATAGINIHTITYSYTDGNGCTATATEDVGVADCTGIEDEEANSINLYPNPTSDILYVESGNYLITNLVIYDITGKIVINLHPNKSLEQIDVSMFCKGVYYVNVADQSGNNKIIKLVKM